MMKSFPTCRTSKTFYSGQKMEGRFTQAPACTETTILIDSLTESSGGAIEQFRRRRKIFIDANLDETLKDASIADEATMREIHDTLDRHLQHVQARRERIHPSPSAGRVEGIQPRITRPGLNRDSISIRLNRSDSRRTVGARPQPTAVPPPPQDQDGFDIDLQRLSALHAREHASHNRKISMDHERTISDIHVVSGVSRLLRDDARAHARSRSDHTEALIELCKTSAAMRSYSSSVPK